MPRDVNTVPINVNLYVQWLSPNKCKPICPMAISLHTPCDIINTVSEIINLYAQWLSQNIRPVAI